MKANEIREKIKAKKKEAQKLSDQAQNSNDVEEVKKINEALKNLTEDVEALEELLLHIMDDDSDNDDSSDNDEVRSMVPDGATYVNGNAAKCFGGSEARSFQIINGGQNRSSVINADVDNFYLRSNETLVSKLKASEKKNLDIGKYIRGAVLGDWTNAPEERAAFTTSTTGVLIPTVLSAQIIDIARNISLFSAAGVPTVNMTGSNNMRIARVKTDPVFAFKEELAEANDSSFELDDVELNAKTAYGIAYMSLETLHSAQNISSIVNKVFAQAFADMIDRGMLYGQNGDTFAPSGIMNDADIHDITATNRGFDDFIRAIGQIKRNNGIPSTLGINAATDEMFSLLTDANGNALQPPKAFESLNQIISNQLIEDENDGSDALVFDSNAMIIGLQNAMTIRITQDSDYCIKNGAVAFQIYSMLDCKATQPKHIAKITGIKNIVVPTP